MTASRLVPGVALLLAALAPLLLPFAALSPNLVHVRRVELRLAAEPQGVMATERSWRLVGPARERRYGPVIDAGNAFLPVVQADDAPQRNDVVSMLALRTRDGSYYPFFSLNASRLAPSLRAPSSDVIAAGAAISDFLRHPAAAPLVLTRSQRYPLGLLQFDLLGLALAVVIGRYWTVPLGVAAYRRLAGAAPERAAAPILGMLARFVDLAAWLGRRR